MVELDAWTIYQDSLPEHCKPTTSFLRHVSVYFGTCLPTPLGFASTLFGCLSILAWLFAQLPQIFKNFQIKSAAGLSIYFLIEWLLGDLTNLLGALFTDQARWQVVLASYYVFVDVCLVYQYVWYCYLLPRFREESIHSGGSDTTDDDDDVSSDLINSLSPINSSFAEDTGELDKDDEEPPKQTLEQFTKQQKSSNANTEKTTLDSFPAKTNLLRTGSDWPIPSPRTMMFAVTLSSLTTQVTAAPLGSQYNVQTMEGKTPIQIAGTILSWCSTALYLGSRLPQLYKNWQRQSTAGLSPLLFLAAFMGNFFYSLSMLTNPNAWYTFGPYGGHGWADQDGSQRGSWIANAAPFFFGAFGVLFSDATMGIQFLIYGEGQEKLVKVRDRRGHSRWRKVSGWMRGWIPSIKKERVVDLSESQRLLSESRDLDRHAYQSRYGGI